MTAKKGTVQVRRITKNKERMLSKYWACHQELPHSCCENLEAKTEKRNWLNLILLSLSQLCVSLIRGKTLTDLEGLLLCTSYTFRETTNTRTQMLTHMAWEARRAASGDSRDTVSYSSCCWTYAVTNLLRNLKEFLSNSCSLSLFENHFQT